MVFSFSQGIDISTLRATINSSGISAVGIFAFERSFCLSIVSNDDNSFDVCSSFASFEAPDVVLIIFCRNLFRLKIVLLHDLSLDFEGIGVEVNIIGYISDK